MMKWSNKCSEVWRTLWDTPVKYLQTLHCTTSPHGTYDGETKHPPTPTAEMPLCISQRVSRLPQRQRPEVACRPSSDSYSSRHNHSFQVRQTHQLWMLRYSASWQEIAVAAAQIPNPYFINMWALIMLPVHTLTLIPLGGASRGGFWNVLPWLSSWHIKTHVHSVNQKWKAMRWDGEYVPPQKSAAHCMGRYCTAAASVAHCPLQTHRVNTLLWKLNSFNRGSTLWAWLKESPG